MKSIWSENYANYIHVAYYRVYSLHATLPRVSVPFNTQSVENEAAVASSRKFINSNSKAGKTYILQFRIASYVYVYGARKK